MPSRKIRPIEIAETADYIRLAVTDNGAGISKENQAKLFKGIIQFSPGKLQEGKGTGLGLYISKGIADMHNGYLMVDSDGEDHGATFTLLLPVQHADSIVSLAPTASPEAFTNIDEEETKSSMKASCKNMNEQNYFGTNKTFNFSSNEYISSQELLKSEKEKMFRGFSGVYML